MNERIEDLESKLAHLELTVEELNQVVYAQGKQLDTARHVIESLRARLKEILENAEDQPFAAEDERPPHY